MNFIPAFINKDFPHLLDAANSAFMEQAFKRYFAQKYPDWAGSIAACHIDQIRYKPGKSCRFLYRIQLQDRVRSSETKAFDQWFVGNMYSIHKGPKSTDLELDGMSSSEGNNWAPVDLWSEMGMVLLAFPFDRKLPHIETLVDPDVIEQLAQAQAGALEMSAAWSCEQAVVHQIKYMPQKRCVLRYDLTWRSLQSETSQTSIYSKTYSTGKSQYIYDSLKNAWEAFTRDTAALTIPRPVLHLDTHNTIWQESWPGTSLSQLVGEGRWMDQLPRVAQSLANWHKGDPEQDFGHVRLAPGPSFDDVLENASGDVEDISTFFEETPPRIQAILDRLESQKRQLILDSIPLTPIHGTFKMGQILVGETDIAVVDFDSVAIGDPLYDVAEFIASILILRTKRGLSLEQVRDATSTFLQIYNAQVPWNTDMARISWYITAFFLAKIHSLLKNLRIQSEEQFVAVVDILDTDLPKTLQLIEKAEKTL